MTFRKLGIFAFCFALLAGLAACIPAVTDSVGGNPGGSNDNGQSSDGTGDNTGGGPTSDGGGDGPSGTPFPTTALVRARIRNESFVQADVTLRFVHDDTVTHLAFVRVLPETETSVAGPVPVDAIELSGVDVEGEALESRTFEYGADFDERNPVQYVIVDQGSSNPPNEPPPGSPVPTDLIMTEPARDVVLALGSTIRTAWADQTSVVGAVVEVFLRSQGESNESGLITAGPAVGAALDGLNDELLMVLQGLPLGIYEVVGRIDDGSDTVTSVAPGHIEVVADLGNVAPSVAIVEPADLVELSATDALRVSWTDEDPDDNATITFSLENADPADSAVGTFVLSAPFAEDPDGPPADSALLPLQGVLPGLFDLVARADDGKLAGTARLRGVVRVLPVPENDAPKIELLEPARDVDVKLGGSFLVKWDDGDENDNARISVLLDPAESASEADEILLIASLGEDDDGAADGVTLGVPTTVKVGSYHVVGIITDGSQEVRVRAPGRVRVVTEPLSGGGPGIPPPPVPQLLVLEPSVEQKVRLSDSIPVRLEGFNLPSDATLGLILSNESAGGNLRLNVTPPGLSPGEDFLLPLSSAGRLPNDAWPRKFELQAEASFAGVTVRAAAAGAIWIRQEVEILDVNMINYFCTSSALAISEKTPFTGMEIRWYGGGFGDSVETAGPIAFWLSNDGAVPADDIDNPTHRLIVSVSESPNQVLVTRVVVEQALGIQDPGPDDPPDESPTALEKGSYRVTGTATPEAFGRLLIPPHPDPVESCYPLKKFITSEP